MPVNLEQANNGLLQQTLVVVVTRRGAGGGRRRGEATAASTASAGAGHGHGQDGFQEAGRVPGVLGTLLHVVPQVVLVEGLLVTGGMASSE